MPAAGTELTQLGLLEELGAIPMNTITFNAALLEGDIPAIKQAIGSAMVLFAAAALKYPEWANGLVEFSGHVGRDGFDEACEELMEHIIIEARHE